MAQIEISSLDIDGSDVVVGDKLVCVSDEFSFNRLKAGAIYTAEAAYDGTPVVIVAGSYHSIDRFRKTA